MAAPLPERTVDYGLQHTLNTLNTGPALTKRSAPMTLTDLNKPAELTLWSSRNPAHTAQGCPFPTLREALAAARKAMDTGNTRPWIITEAGDILAPDWIRANAVTHHPQ